MTQLDRLQVKLRQSLAATWEHTQPIDIVLDPPPQLLSGSAVMVGAVYLVQSRKGEWIEVHRQSATMLNDDEAVDEFLASGLSTFLMKHPTWPK